MNKEQLAKIINAYSKDKTNLERWTCQMENLLQASIYPTITDDKGIQRGVLDLENFTEYLKELVLDCDNIQKPKENDNSIEDYNKLEESIFNWLVCDTRNGGTFQELDKLINNQGYFFGGKNETIQ